MTMYANYEGQYVVTCGDRFEAGVAMARCNVSNEIGGISVTSSVDPSTVRIDHAREILEDRAFYLTAEFRGEPIVIWPIKDWEEYARDQFILPETV